MTLIAVRDGRARLARVILALVLVAGCGADVRQELDGAASTSEPEGSGSTTRMALDGGTSSRTTIPAEEPSGGALIEVVVEAGAVTGGAGRTQVALGEEVTLRVTSDVADEVHVHGYDRVAEVAPGQVAAFRFSPCSLPEGEVTRM